MLQASLSGVGVEVSVGVAPTGVGDGVGVGVAPAGGGEAVGVSGGDAASGDGAAVDSSVGAGKGDSGSVGVGAWVAVSVAVSVAPALKVSGVAVDVGTWVEGTSVALALVGKALASAGAGWGVDGNGVALGTTVMRSIGEPRVGVEVANGIGVGLAGNVGEGGLVGVGSLREHAAKISTINSCQMCRLIASLVAALPSRAGKPCLLPLLESPRVPLVTGLCDPSPSWWPSSRV